ncbi:MAG: sensor histidine kinase [Nevskiaceae bacterium]
MVAPATLEMVRMQARFLASMDHELRAPLNAIIGLGETLASGMVPDPRRQSEFAGQIVANARQLLQLINSLLELARADAGLLELTPQPADLAGLVSDALRLVEPAATRRGVTISADLEQAPARVTLDASRIMHALHALLTAAIALTPGGHRIALRVVAEDERRVRLELTGLNIGPGHTGEFLVPTPGAWLGLALARSIVEAHGGEFGATRAPGGKSTVLHAVLPGVTAGG